MLGAFLTALPVVAIIAACDLALLYGALWLGAQMSQPIRPELKIPLVRKLLRTDKSAR